MGIGGYNEETWERMREKLGNNEDSWESNLAR
jgi:hypothetical protein